MLTFVFASNACTPCIAASAIGIEADRTTALRETPFNKKSQAERVLVQSGPFNRPGTILGVRENVYSKRDWAHTNELNNTNTIRIRIVRAAQTGCRSWYPLHRV